MPADVLSFFPWLRKIKPVFSASLWHFCKNSIDRIYVSPRKGCWWACFLKHSKNRKNPVGVYNRILRCIKTYQWSFPNICKHKARMRTIDRNSSALKTPSELAYTHSVGQLGILVSYYLPIIEFGYFEIRFQNLQKEWTGDFHTSQGWYAHNGGRAGHNCRTIVKRRQNYLPHPFYARKM